MVTDLYRGERLSIVAPAQDAVSVTPNDTTDLDITTRALYIGTSGDVTVHMKGQSTSVTFKAVPVGVLSIRVDRVLLAGTTAADILALW